MNYFIVVFILANAQSKEIDFIQGQSRDEGRYRKPHPEEGHTERFLLPES